MNHFLQGDNNVLLQQASNWLIKIWLESKGRPLTEESPLGSLSFSQRKSVPSRFSSKTLDDLLQPQTLLDTYKWLVSWLLRTTAEKYTQLQKQGRDQFASKNDSQIYKARTLSLAYIEHHVMEMFWIKIQNPNIPSDIRNALVKLLLLYGYWSLEKHLTTLYQGGYATGPLAANLIREGILRLCEEMKTDAVALADSIAPPDFILNSCLGKSDGQVYKNLQLAMSQTPKGFERDSYWKDIVTKINSKI
jgi:acyl-CoA oxidase